MNCKMLTVRAPWSSLIVSGHKRLECRNFNTRYRGLLLIHSAGRPWVEPSRGFLDAFLLRQEVRRPKPVLSAVVGVVDLVDVVPASRRGSLPEALRPWAFDFYDYYWVLTDPRPLPATIPYSAGQLGLYDPPAELIARLTAAHPQAAAGR